EDVVAGVRTPGPLMEIDVDPERPGPGSLERAMPETHSKLLAVVANLERHYRDVQDVEFTIQEGRLFLLQTRNAKRTPAAAVKIAVDLVEEALIDRNEAVLRIDPAAIDTLLHPQVDPEADVQVIGKGLPASPGAASGEVVFDSEEAERQAKLGRRVILVREETSPEDIAGMDASAGILTQTGGMTSHAAVVARGMGRPCITGCQGLQIGTDGAQATFVHQGKSVKVRAGDSITLDGTRGLVVLGDVPTVEADLGGEIARLLGWADRRRRLSVRTNADTPKDVARAVELGAEGIGLCRTEHMFFGPERILVMRQMILADSDEGRRAALERLEPFQRADFEAIFRALGGRPATIRLLDPPLHEFLPREPEEMELLAESLSIGTEEVVEAVRALSETNPMLGHRGCRLGISYPEIYAMQVRAIFEAALSVSADGTHVAPEIMVPLVMHPKELEITRAQIESVAESTFEAEGRSVPFTIGTMIELPRAAIGADTIARHADFFSFGTNDLTQTTLGISRDDGARFVPSYVDRRIFRFDPFARLDEDGVGYLVKVAIDRGKLAKPSLKLGICGEHGGEAHSIDFFHRAGLDYVSASPYRVPAARLAAAQSSIRETRLAKESSAE
ncbi:MAG: pyruvate, phosphate dikinase, partial [Myxococcota bacterium]